MRFFPTPPKRPGPNEPYYTCVETFELTFALLLCGGLWYMAAFIAEHM
ncbi:MAG: hypothetical protein JXK05_13095 [Campylobacterales bacterium]|nr:hypothetical protein [Campylobacterales bacterium]